MDNTKDNTEDSMEIKYIKYFIGQNAKHLAYIYKDHEKNSTDKGSGIIIFELVMNKNNNKPENINVNYVPYNMVEERINSKVLNENNENNENDDNNNENKYISDTSENNLMLLMLLEENKNNGLPLIYALIQSPNFANNNDFLITIPINDVIPQMPTIINNNTTNDCNDDCNDCNDNDDDCCED